MDNITGPDPREDSAERYDATITIELRITKKVVTCNRDADYHLQVAVTMVEAAIETMGYDVDAHGTEIEKA